MGLMSRAKYRRLKRACTTEVCESAVEHVAGKSGRDWPLLSALWTWIIENWDEILKFIIMVAPLVLDERDA